MPRAERPVSIWEIVEIVTSASESVGPFAVQFAKKVIGLESKGKIKVEPLPNQMSSQEEDEIIKERQGT